MKRLLILAALVPAILMASPLHYKRGQSAKRTAKETVRVTEGGENVYSHEINVVADVRLQSVRESDNGAINPFFQVSLKELKIEICGPERSIEFDSTKDRKLNQAMRRTILVSLEDRGFSITLNNRDLDRFSFDPVLHDYIFDALMALFEREFYIEWQGKEEGSSWTDQIFIDEGPEARYVIEQADRQAVKVNYNYVDEDEFVNGSMTYQAKNPVQYNHVAASTLMEDGAIIYFGSEVTSS